MGNNIEKLAHDTFESIKQIDNDGNEFWYARALAKVLDYTDYRNFIKVIEKAKSACNLSNNNASDHFVDVNEMIQIGKGGQREIDNVILSRYACYLIVQNGDSSKPIIANGQTYFAIQTRRQELLDQQNDVEERLDARAKLRASETELSENIYQRGVDDKGFGRIRSKGDGALFGGFNTSNMKSKLNVPKNRALADFLPTVTITAKNLATEITNHNVKQKNLQGETNITDEHIENNSSVRGLLVERGIKPKNLPASEDIKKLERKTNRLPQEDESPKLKAKKND